MNEELLLEVHARVGHTPSQCLGAYTDSNLPHYANRHTIGWKYILCMYGCMHLPHSTPNSSRYSMLKGLKMRVEKESHELHFQEDGNQNFNHPTLLLSKKQGGGCVAVRSSPTHMALTWA
jgi:hypothetical protein